MHSDVGWVDGQEEQELDELSSHLPEGTFFYKSIDVLESIKTGVFLQEQFDKMVAEIGVKHVIQVITNNHTSYVNVGARLLDRRLIALT